MARWSLTIFVSLLIRNPEGLSLFHEFSERQDMYLGGGQWSGIEKMCSLSSVERLWIWVRLC
jgi:hypothetical protein